MNFQSKIHETFRIKIAFFKEKLSQAYCKNLIVICQFSSLQGLDNNIMLF